jgi:hypothetical protein
MRARYDDSHFYSQLLGRQRWGGLKVKASPGKNLMRTPTQPTSLEWWYRCRR